MEPRATFPSLQRPAASGRLETVAELRDLFRASESRAARLRLLVETGRDLAAAESRALEEVVATAAQRAALFSGFQSGVVIRGDAPAADASRRVVELRAPVGGRGLGWLALSGRSAGRLDPEDEEALTLLAQLISAALDSHERELQLEGVVARLFTAQEEERRRLAHDLHDGVAQVAGAALRQVEAYRAFRGDLSGEEDQALAKVQQLTQRTVREIRALIGGLRPTALDDLGLEAALTAEARLLADEGYALTVSSNLARRPPPLHETAFFRVGQEALNNIRKHSGGPCPVSVRLRVAEGALELVVEDEGRGFAAEPARAKVAGEHIGLAVMQERLAALDGSLEVGSRGSGGVRLRATAPLP
jgi:hypothetical protein